MKVSWFTTIAALAFPHFRRRRRLRIWSCCSRVNRSRPKGPIRHSAAVLDGQLDGLEIRVMKEVAKRLGLEYTPVLIKWDESACQV